MLPDVQGVHVGDGFCHIICSVEQFPIIFIVSLDPKSFPPNLDDLPAGLAILTLRSLDKWMPCGYTDDREMLRMKENEMLSLILGKLESLEAGQKDMHAEINGMHAEINGMHAEMKEVNRRLDILENGQKDVNRRLDSLEDGQKDMRADMKEANRRLDTLEEGQKTIRRDVARVERKIDRLGNDVGDTLAIVTEATDYEISKLREAK